jgi:hypothetical protein
MVTRGKGAQDGGAERPEVPDEGGTIEQIERVDALVDGHLADGTTEVPAGSDGFVASIQRVRALADEPLPTGTRQRHLRRIRTHEVPAAATRRHHVRARPARAGALRRRLVAVTAGSLAVLMLTAGSAVGLAQGADPDDVLYGVKRASEQAWLAVPRGSERAAEVHLALAERRIDEAQRAPEHAERLVTDGIRNAEAAEKELPADAVENLLRLLGDGPDRLPDNASPAARAALHRNCVRIADRHDLGPERCGPAPEGAHPGRGRGMGEGAHPGRGRGLDKDDHPGRGRGLEGDEHPGRGQGLDRDEHPGRGLGHRGHDDAIGPRGWGPGGRPDGAVGPPPGTPGYDRWDPDGHQTDD